jgi:hypothetical protein
MGQNESSRFLRTTEFDHVRANEAIHADNGAGASRDRDG